MSTTELFSANGRANGPRLVRSSSDEPARSAVAKLAMPSEPFATDTAGADYFTTDYHHRFLARAIRDELKKARGFVLVSGEPEADGELLSRLFTDDKETGYRVALVRCEPGMAFDDVVRAYSRQLGLRADDDSGRLWALLSHLMLEARNGITRVLIVENAGALDIRTFDELHRFARLDDPHLMSVVLLSSPAFVQRLEAAPLNFLKPAIVGQILVQTLHPEEVGAFIHYQLNAVADTGRTLSPESVASIAEAAKGNPAIVNRLARQALGPARTAQPEPPPPPPAAPPQPAPPPFLTPTPPPLLTPSPPPPQASAPMPPTPSPVPPRAATPPPTPVPTPPAPPRPPSVPLARTGEIVPDDPIPDIPLVLPTATPAPADPTDSASAQARTIRAVKAAAPAIKVAPASPPKAPATSPVPTAPAVKALSEAERLATKPPLATPSAPLTLTLEADEGVGIAETAAPRRRPQMASGVAAGIYVLAVVLSGAALLYLFDPGFRQSAPSPSAVATIPPRDVTSAGPPPARPVTAPAIGRDDASVPPPAVEPPAAAVANPPPVDVPPAPAPLAPAVVKEVAPTAPSTPSTAMTEAAPAVAALAPAKEAAAPPSLPSPPPEVAIAPPAAIEPPPEAEARAAATAEPVTAPVPSSSKPATEPPAQTNALATPPTKLGVPAAAPEGRVAAVGPKVVPPSDADITAPAPTPPPRATTTEPAQSPEVVVLVRRGDEFLAAGDIISARRFFERAAQTGDATAACGLGKSYDPLFLRQAGVRGVTGDPTKAAGWYRTAVAAGNTEAVYRLKRLEAAYPNR